MAAKWKEIWEKRDFNYEILNTNDDNLIFQELKRANGFDVVNGGLTINALLRQHELIKNNFAKAFKYNDFGNVKSIYEVGCGCGGNLYLFNREGLRVGGIDYSKPLVNVAKKVLNSIDIICDEAVNLPLPDFSSYSQDGIYDVVLSNSVFSYFPNFKYANTVLDKMYKKCKYAIGLIDIHNVEKEKEFTQYRIETVENYKERYKDLNKLFYSKDFFMEFAKNHDMDILFTESDIEGYWNNDFIFNCFMYKR